MSKKDQESKEIMVKENELTMPDGIDFNLQEVMEGVEARLPQIGIIHQGQLFVMPDEKKLPSFLGIILDNNRSNAWWSEEFSSSGGNEPPTCFSSDGVVPDKFVENPVAPSCRTCKNNQFGSDGGRGKACKNMKRLHILLVDAGKTDGMPSRLTIPPSGLKQIDLYIAKLASKGIPYFAVLTVFKLKEAKNKDGIKYSEIVYETIQVLQKEEIISNKNLRDRWLPVMRGQSVEKSEYQADI